MDEAIATQETIPDITPEIGRVYEVLNSRLFEGKLKPVKIEIQPRKKVALRYFSESETLVIGSDFTNLKHGAPGHEILTALLHEMIHIRNHQNGVVDCTTNQYHNKNFLQSALAVGLVVIKHKTQGWAITTTIYPRNVVDRDYIRKPQKEATLSLMEVFNSIKLDKSICKNARTAIRMKLKEEKPTKNYFLKYVCNCHPPHNSIRSGRRPDGPNALHIQCLDCRSTFVCATELDPVEDDEE